MRSMTQAAAERKPDLLRIGNAAQAAGLTPRAVRYYEEIGLLAPAAHARGANRRYDEDDIERLRLIRHLRDVVGLGLAETREYLETEDAARALRARYRATADRAAQLALLECAEPVLRRRVALLEQKLASVEQLLEEERARLDRNRALQREHRASLRAAAKPSPA